MAIPRVRRKTIYETDLSRLLERLEFYNHNPAERWIFRGVTDLEKHDLIPSIGRSGMRKDSSGLELPPRT